MALTSSWFEASGKKMPLLRPSRSTTMRSATARTSSMLWLIMITPRPRSRTRSIRSSTSAVCATPSAAVGSSSMISFGSSSSERAIATVWRWPPDSEATGSRTLGMRAESSLSSVQARISIATSSSWSGLSSLPRKMLATTSRFSHSARSWKTVAMPSPSAALGSLSVDGLAAKGDGARAGLMDAGQDLDQRRLARAVVADQRHDLAGMDVEIDVGQGRDGAEMLGDAAQAEHRFAGGVIAFGLFGHRPWHKQARSSGRRAAAGRCSARDQLRDAELLAALGIAVDAELFGRVDLLVDDLGLEVLGVTTAGMKSCEGVS